MSRTMGLGRAEVNTFAVGLWKLYGIQPVSRNCQVQISKLNTRSTSLNTRRTRTILESRRHATLHVPRYKVTMGIDNCVKLQDWQFLMSHSWHLVEVKFCSNILSYLQSEPEVKCQPTSMLAMMKVLMKTARSVQRLNGTFSIRCVPYKVDQLVSSWATQKLFDAAGGKPTKSRLERLKLSNLAALCCDFGLWDNVSGRKLTKKELVKRIILRMEDLEVLPCVSLLLLRCVTVLKIKMLQSDDADSDSGTKPGSTIRVRLYRNPSDYETRYVTEVEAPRLPCGGLDLRDLPDLFQSKGIFEVNLPPYST